MTSPLFPGSILSLPARAAELLCKADAGDGALLYLHLLRCGTADGLGWSSERLNAALEVLKKLGMAPAAEVTLTPPPAAEPADLPVPEYTTETITTALADRQSPFTQLCDTVEQMLGKKLSVNDMKTLYSLYDHLALAPEVILMLVTWCTEECSRKYGPGRKPFLSQIRKEGFIWARQGLETVEQVEQYLRRRAASQTHEREVLRLLDLPDRPLVTREREYISAWQEMGFDHETLRIAYEKTVLKKGAHNWSYMNAILRRWHEKGLHTAAAVREAEQRPSGKPNYGGKTDPQLDERVRQEMERTRRLMQKMKDD